MPNQAVELSEAAPSEGWALGVQFHPEENPADRRLFRGFTEAAKRYAAGHRARTRPAA